MSSIAKGKRKPSSREAEHHYYRLRTEVTDLMLLDFGFSEEKYLKNIEKYRRSHSSDPNVEEIVERYKKKCDSFNTWFIDRECDAILKILRNIEASYTFGIHTRVINYQNKKGYLNDAISQCHMLKQEIQYVIRTLPVDLNKYKRFAVLIKEQIDLYSGIYRSIDSSV